MGNALKCPSCGRTDEFTTVEQMTGTGYHNRISDDPTEDYDLRETIWDDDESIGILCACGWELHCDDWHEVLIELNEAAS